jgi:prevent-host-death family protein
MRTVGLKVLKNKLSEYVGLAASGERVVVTDRGRAVAKIVPPRPKPDSVIERGAREGWLMPAGNPGGIPPGRCRCRADVRAAHGRLGAQQRGSLPIYIDSSVALSQLMFEAGLRPRSCGSSP